MACFYADDGLVSARDVDTLQKTFDVLTGLFDRVGFHTNTTKTEVMICVAGRIRTPLDEDAYEARMSDLHRAERKGRKVECPTCGEPLAVGLLRNHLTSRNDQYQCFLSPAAGEERDGDPKVERAGTPAHLASKLCKDLSER